MWQQRVSIVFSPFKVHAPRCRLLCRSFTKCLVSTFFKQIRCGLLALMIQIIYQSIPPHPATGPRMTEAHPEFFRFRSFLSQTTAAGYVEHTGDYQMIQKRKHWTSLNLCHPRPLLARHLWHLRISKDFFSKKWVTKTSELSSGPVPQVRGGTNAFVW